MAMGFDNVKSELKNAARWGLCPSSLRYSRNHIIRLSQSANPQEAKLTRALAPNRAILILRRNNICIGCMQFRAENSSAHRICGQARPDLVECLARLSVVRPYVQRMCRHAK